MSSGIELAEELAGLGLRPSLILVGSFVLVSGHAR
jgi:hypothetical protein